MKYNPVIQTTSPKMPDEDFSKILDQKIYFTCPFDKDAKEIICETAPSSSIGGTYEFKCT